MVLQALPFLSCLKMGFEQLNPISVKKKKKNIIHNLYKILSIYYFQVFIIMKHELTLFGLFIAVSIATAHPIDLN